MLSIPASFKLSSPKKGDGAAARILGENQWFGGGIVLKGIRLLMRKQSHQISVVNQSASVVRHDLHFQMFSPIEQLNFGRTPLSNRSCLSSTWRFKLLKQGRLMHEGCNIA